MRKYGWAIVNKRGDIVKEGVNGTTMLLVYPSKRIAKGECHAIETVSKVAFMCKKEAS